MGWDVAVAGSGPAGSMAAYILAEAGRHVVLFEKEKLPRYKVSWGGVVYGGWVFPTFKD